MIRPVYEAAELQQLFADVNGNASKPNRSLSLYFDRSTRWNRDMVDIINEVDFVAGNIDVEKNTVPAKSDKVFTTSMIHAAMRHLFPDQGELSETDKQLAGDILELMHDSGYWPCLKGEMSAFEMREKFLNPHSVFLNGMMRVVRACLSEGHQMWEIKFPLVERDDSRFQLRCIVGDRIKAGNKNSILVGNAFKLETGLELTEEEHKAEYELEAQQRTISKVGNKT